MHVAALTAWQVRLPLKHPIQHASASRESSDNIVVCCRLSDGSEGWGEGVPRQYVTGETADGAIEQFLATPLAEQLHGDCRGWADVITLCERFQPAVMGDDPRGCYGNSLRAAVEISLLDAFGRSFGEPASQVVSHFEPAQGLRQQQARVRYSGVITCGSRLKETTAAAKMRVYGFAECKIKVGLPGDDDTARLRRFRRWLGKRVDIRLDANEAWPAGEVVRKMEPLRGFGITSLEQPVPHEEVAALAEVRNQLDVPIMLDESLTSLADANSAIEAGTCDLFNLRLSKCGGFLNCLRLAALARQHGLGYQLGCHPGESAILSAAGRHFATAVAGIRYLEGSYDRHVLAEQFTEPDITFGYGGWAPALAGPGLGIQVRREKLERLATRKVEFPLATTTKAASAVS
jgi:muconate cycloisomerase